MFLCETVRLRIRTHFIVKELRLKRGGLSLQTYLGDDGRLDLARFSGSPASTGMLPVRGVLVSDIITGLEIRIETIATLSAKEEALRTTIIASNVTTTRTALTGFPGVDFDHPNPTLSRLVFHKGNPS
jgi:hypothetical protein